MEGKKAAHVALKEARARMEKEMTIRTIVELDGARRDRNLELVVESGEEWEGGVSGTARAAAAAA